MHIQHRVSNVAMRCTVLLQGILTGLLLNSNGICLNTQLAVKVNILLCDNLGVVEL